MRPNARVVHLQLKPAHGAPMRPVSAAEAVADHGLRGDAAFGRGRRQVLLVERETLDEFGLRAGDLRENMTVEGLRLTGLPLGTHVLVGGARLEVTGDCAPCDFIEAKRPGLRAALAGRRGTLFRVAEGGEIRVGDEVRIVESGR